MEKYFEYAYFVIHLIIPLFLMCAMINLSRIENRIEIRGFIIKTFFETLNVSLQLLVIGWLAIGFSHDELISILDNSFFNGIPMLSIVGIIACWKVIHPMITKCIKKIENLVYKNRLTN